MTIITIQVTSTPVQAALDELNRRCAHLQPVFSEIGEVIFNHVVDCFKQEKSPDGINWAALSPATLKKRGANAKKLRDTGSMFRSLGYNAANDHAEITIGQEYAAMMNFGGTKAQFPHLWGDIPARPFFPSQTLPQEWQNDVMDVLNSYLAT